MAAFFSTCLAAYLVGGIPFGYLVARWRGVDIFQSGSGNIGATNVGRVLGRRYGILVFVLDFAKGALPVVGSLFLRERLSSLSATLPSGLLEVGAGLAAFLGHLFPLYLRFHGGKGVATGAGVVAVLLPGPMVGALLTWLVVVASFRYVSLASLAAAVALCSWRLVFTPAPFTREDLILTLFCFVAAGLVFLRHHANLRRLLNANENRLQDTLAMQQFSKIIHLLALGLWFGMTVFFTFVVALTLFPAFEAEAEKSDRPLWFPASYEFRIEKQKEQGTRAAAFAVTQLFPTYYLLQGICGFLAIVPALSWSRTAPRERVHHVRLLILLLSLATVLVAWPIERKVGDLRITRNNADDALRKKLVEENQTTSPQLKKAVQTAREESDQARADFGLWHTVSLFLNFITVALVTVALALASRLPNASLNRRPQAGAGAPSAV